MVPPSSSLDDFGCCLHTCGWLSGKGVASSCWLAVGEGCGQWWLVPPREAVGEGCGQWLLVPLRMAVGEGCGRMQ